MKKEPWGHISSSVRRGAAVVAVGLISVSGPASAALVGVVSGVSNGPGSGGGTLASIIAAPSDALDNVVTNTGIQGFDEAQGVTTTVDHSIDGGGIIPAGTVVDSHMLFLNSESGDRIAQQNTLWTFDGEILGVMSDTGGLLEAASTFELGAPGTNYTVGPGAAPYDNRGIEEFGPDEYSILPSGKTLQVTLLVTTPGDWIRVVTAPSPIPLPGAAWLFASALGVFGYLGKKKQGRA